MADEILVKASNQLIDDTLQKQNSSPSFQVLASIIFAIASQFLYFF